MRVAWKIKRGIKKRVANHHTFGFLENNSYVFDGSLFYLLGDHCVKFQEEIVEHFQYVLTSLDTYVKNLISFKTLFERAFGFKFFLVHYKEFLFLKEYETHMGSYFKVSDTNICELLESNEASFVLGIEDQRKSGGKGVLLSPTNSSISFLTNSSPTYLEFYSKELKLFINSYAFH
ncbi:hypothetical protein M9H77_23348 [Catharanthus roseus]|uniref:Uncharacterized protein n=1 Tax=Catharanthus roseus TaxID=4058 RepID=A0ACC0AUS2_CATRO|nr:hypothetical protein M9H77_23348 [Catharanthus roseus]